jgi:K+-transporting ATPase ATPase C chain
MTEQKEKWNFKPIIGLAVVSLLICGLFFPLLVTGIAQVFLPYQANGEIVQLNGKTVGSDLIAQTFTLPIFFHPRNDSASGVDPHIPLADAYAQIPTISNATDRKSVV